MNAACIVPFRATFFSRTDVHLYSLEMEMCTNILPLRCARKKPTVMALSLHSSKKGKFSWYIFITIAGQGQGKLILAGLIEAGWHINFYVSIGIPWASAEPDFKPVISSAPRACNNTLHIKFNGVLSNGVYRMLVGNRVYVGLTRSTIIPLLYSSFPFKGSNK